MFFSPDVCLAMTIYSMYVASLEVTVPSLSNSDFENMKIVEGEENGTLKWQLMYFTSSRSHYVE